MRYSLKTGNFFLQKQSSIKRDGSSWSHVWSQKKTNKYFASKFQKCSMWPVFSRLTDFEKTDWLSAARLLRGTAVENRFPRVDSVNGFQKWLGIRTKLHTIQTSMSYICITFITISFFQYWIRMKSQSHQRVKILEAIHLLATQYAVFDNCRRNTKHCNHLFGGHYNWSYFQHFEMPLYLKKSVHIVTWWSMCCRFCIGWVTDV